MINYGKVQSNIEPPKIETTDNMIFIANNIQKYTTTIDDHLITGYEYDYIGYTKNEYITLLSEQNEELKEELLDTQVALCDVYELLEGGME